MELLREVVRLMCEDVVSSTLVRKYPNVPEYVLRDMFRGEDMKLFGMFNRLTWRLEVIDANPASFSPETQRQLMRRQFGRSNPDNVPNDEERTQFQARLAAQTQPGQNEPVIVVKAIDGYRLWEGWHRVMALLCQGDNGGAPEAWDKVKIRAWVGSSR